MIKKNMKLMIISSIIILLPIIAGIVFWDQLPDQMPIHWNYSGEVDRWASKTFSVVFFPFLLLGIHWLCIAGTTLDPKKKNHPDKVLSLLMWIVPVLSVVMNSFVYAYALGNDINIEIVTTLLVGILFTVIGNYLPKCKQNYTIGIKIPWTLHSEENWNRTHRFGGIIWTISGIILILSSFVRSVFLVLPVLLIMALVPVIYSYMLYRKGI